MICRIGHFNENSNIARVFELKNKFNDALNQAVAKINQYMMTINSYNTFEHFDYKGDLSDKGKVAFLQELDELVEKFDLGKIKLLPAPRNTFRKGPAHAPPRFPKNSNQQRDMRDEAGSNYTVQSYHTMGYNRHHGRPHNSGYSYYSQYNY